MVGVGAALWSSLAVFSHFQALAGQSFPRLAHGFLDRRNSVRRTRNARIQIAPS
jgi:hypothetical protein